VQDALQAKNDCTNNADIKGFDDPNRHRQYNDKHYRSSDWKPVESR